MTLAEKLVALRKQKGLTQKDLAERLHVSRQAVSRWEVGAAIPGTDNLKRLGELYGVPVDYFLNDVAESIQETEASLTNVEQIPKRTIKPLTLCYIIIIILVIVVVMLIGVFMPRNQNLDQAVPMEDLYTRLDDGYFEGTFTIK